MQTKQGGGINGKMDGAEGVDVEQGGGRKWWHGVEE